MLRSCLLVLLVAALALASFGRVTDAADVFSSRHAPVGGFSAAKPADEVVAKLFNSDEVKEGIRLAIGGASPDAVTVQSYTTQVVAGVNYKAQVTVNGERYTVKVFKPLPYTKKAAEVTNVASGWAEPPTDL